MSTDHVTLAREAVELAVEYIRKHRATTVTAKGDRDMVTDIDIAVERLVRKHLAQAAPGIGFLGEEEGRTGAADGLCWVLDPIDGTANFARDIELCAVSLALVDDGAPIVGVIRTPYLGHEYFASLGAGTTLDGRPTHVSSTTQLRHAIVAIGDYATGADAEAKNIIRLDLTARLAAQAQRVRMFGSIAMDLTYIAAGKIDASITLNNKPWDTAAGVLIAREAGALVMDVNGTDHSATSGTTVAATPGIRDSVVHLLADTSAVH